MNNLENEIDNLFDKKRVKKLTPLNENQIKNIALIKTIENVKEFVPVKKEDPKQKDTSIKDEDPDENLDTIQEQIEAPMTTIHSDEAIKDKELKKVSKNPENYIEINVIKKIRIVDSFYISSKLKHFKYKDMEYDIIEEKIYILPTKGNYFMPTSFYYEGDKDPISFKQTNKGITGKALSLLYNSKLYADLFSEDETKYNLFIVVFLMISITAYFIGLYYLLGGTI